MDHSLQKSPSGNALRDLGADYSSIKPGGVYTALDPALLLPFGLYLAYNTHVSGNDGNT